MDSPKHGCGADNNISYSFATTESVMLPESFGSVLGRKKRFGDKINVASENCGTLDSLSLASAKDLPAISFANVLVSSLGISAALILSVTLVVPSFVVISFTS